MSQPDQDHSTPATIRIESPGVSTEEVAAVLAMLSALGGGGPEPSARRSHWAGRARIGWRSSSLPSSRFVEHLPR